MIRLALLCVGFVALDDLPKHVQEQIMMEKQEEQREKERQEWEKNLCKVSRKCYCCHWCTMFSSA